MNEEMVFRVVLADGSEREVAAERASGKSQWRAEYSLDNGHHSHEHARSAVASLVASLGWEFVDIVGPGEKTRAELNATIAELRNEVTRLNHAYPVGWYESRAPDRQLPFQTDGYVSGGAS